MICTLGVRWTWTVARSKSFRFGRAQPSASVACRLAELFRVSIDSKQQQQQEDVGHRDSSARGGTQGVAQGPSLRELLYPSINVRLSDCWFSAGIRGAAHQGHRPEPQPDGVGVLHPRQEGGKQPPLFHLLHHSPALLIARNQFNVCRVKSPRFIKVFKFWRQMTPFCKIEPFCLKIC